MPIEILQVDPAEWIDRIGRLRAEVWKAEGVSLGENEDRLTDDYEMQSLHWIALSDGELVASARLTVGSVADLMHGDLIKEHDPQATDPSAEFMRLVVHPNYRGKSIAIELIRKRLDYAISTGCTKAYAVTFSRPEMLASAGFEVIATLDTSFFLGLEGHSINRPEIPSFMFVKRLNDLARH